MTASETYRAPMEWKRATHQEHHAAMIGCYACEKLEGGLLDSLKEKLEAASVALKPKSPEELWAQAAGKGASLLDGLVELLETLINLIKSNGYGIAEAKALNASGSSARANAVLLSLLEPIFSEYCQYLLAHVEIDFNDMINLAAECVRQGKYVNPYKQGMLANAKTYPKPASRFWMPPLRRKAS